MTLQSKVPGTTETISVQHRPESQYFPSLPTSNVDKIKPLPLNRQNFTLIKNGGFEVLQTPFIDEYLCDLVMNEVTPLLSSKTTASTYVAELALLGPSLYDYLDDPETYFNDAQAADRFLRENAPHRTEVIQRVIKKLEEVSGTPISFVHSTKYNADCFAGLGRHTSSIYLHTDSFLIKSPPPWGFPRLKNQFAVNVFLTRVDSGGQCIAFDRPKTLEDEYYRLPSSVSDYGYLPKIVEDADCRVMQPIKGSMTIFRAENLHTVLPKTGGPRMTFGMFMGELDDGSGRMALWS